MDEAESIEEALAGIGGLYPAGDADYYSRQGQRIDPYTWGRPISPGTGGSVTPFGARGATWPGRRSPFGVPTASVPATTEREAT